ncbi:hypothetical protein O7614_22745 [Micromonospora sp. WMMD961]|uniref:hypothetical protein n=1 Tax=Micromonospora sp. WMMD961 TaxID=3016100 RepID=UPI0024168F48|nr:hypothetical protein [Micromonospora sp. WMMD961]MDG4782481.1 hypothetical protein [Micromonospora sp. WMMD961]
MAALSGAVGARTPAGVDRGADGGCGGAQGEVVAAGPPAEGRIAASVARDSVGPDSADRALESGAALTGSGVGVGGGPCCPLGVGADGPR